MLGLRQIARTALPALMTALVSFSAGAACLPIPQPDPEELRRDQEAIIHKAERLRDLMHTLLARYRTEGRTHHVKLLEKGLEHLGSVGLVEDVAGIRDSLRDQALTEALRQQGGAIEDLERLLAILLDRRSIENLEKEIKTTTRLAATASELLQRQTDLRNETREQTASKPSEAEQNLLDRLAALAQKQRDESDRNQRSAGIRAPFLEDAMKRVQQLLEQQEQLEQATEQQLSGRGALSKEASEERFRLGELEQAQRELFDRRSRDRALSRAAAAASDLKRALNGSDDEAEREALSRLLGRLEAAASRSEPETKGPLDEWRKQLSELGARPDQRDALQRVADEIEKGATERAAALREKSGAALDELEAQLEQAADDLAHDKPQQPGSSSQALSKAQKALAEAGKLAEQNELARAMAKMSEASRALAEARKRHRSENPDAQQIASDMAGEASQVAGGLRRTPVIDGQDEAPEKAAADALEAAEEALRQAADQLSPRNEATKPVAKDVDESREQLESARDRLQQAMAGETGSRQSQMQQAASRQQGLQQEAQQLRGEMNSGDDADLRPEQRDAADKPIRQAEDLMQKARQSLQKGRQSTAAEQQAQAARALERASEAMERERPLDADQSQALRDLADQQEQLEEDIIRLAREVEERKNERAKQALDEATDAAAKAKEAMRDGDNQETDEQQQEARDRLQDAKEALEEERDRYQDLRLEELLFRMREELVAFLEKQQPITQATREAQESLGDNTRMTRRVRRKLNDLAGQEAELVSKAEYLRTALEEEGTLVFSHALKTNEEDLGEVSRRLAGRYPDPGELTVMLQEDVEERTTKLIEALKREQERRRNEDQNGGENEDSGEQGQDQASRPRLVPILAELQMLRQMEQDMLERTEHMTTLVGSRGADGITDLETALMERMANRHHAVTRIFLQLKAQLEQAMQQPDAETPEEEKNPNKDEDK